VLAAAMISQAVGSLFGFWDNEASRRASVEGLPPYVTYSMVLAALECQDKYGHPAGCTLAQVIVESGVGDHLSGLATRDNNLFGIKWAPSFASCPEVAGKESWQTREEYEGASVTVVDAFTRFRSYEDCIRFRSRVLLQAGRYSGNEKIRRAIEGRDSDLMAEGLKDAGYATSSSYVDSLKAAMDAYGLRRFDSMSADDLRRAGPAGAASGKGATIVAAAQTQLGTPYVWGGSTPNKALDCSGPHAVVLRAGGNPDTAPERRAAEGGDDGAALPGGAGRHPLEARSRRHLHRRRLLHTRAAARGPRPRGHRDKPVHVRGQNPVGREGTWRRGEGPSPRSPPGRSPSRWGRARRAALRHEPTGRARRTMARRPPPGSTPRTDRAPTLAQARRRRGSRARRSSSRGSGWAQRTRRSG
jgi:hypothetical protein